MKKLAVLLVGTGRMGGHHAQRYASLPDVSVVAAVDVDQARLAEFCTTHRIPNAYTTISDALSQHRFDAASIVTPDAWHAPGSISCLQAGLAVLCEKPLSDSPGASEAMVAAAQRSGLVNMVNLSYRESGALHTAQQWISQGRLGQIRHVEASYRQSWLCSPYWGDWKTEESWLWRLSTAHGSAGVLGDIGVHILDFLTACVGMEITGVQCRLQTFDKAPGNRIGDYILDANDSCVMTIELDNGALGVVHMSRFQTGYVNDLFLTIHGTEGAVKVSTGNEGDKLTACIGDDIHSQCWREIACDKQPDTFTRFVDAVRRQRSGSPDFAHACSLQRVMDLCELSHREGNWQTVPTLSSA